MVETLFTSSGVTFDEISQIVSFSMFGRADRISSGNESHKGALFVALGCEQSDGDTPHLPRVEDALSEILRKLYHGEPVRIVRANEASGRRPEMFVEHSVLACGFRELERCH